MYWEEIYTFDKKIIKPKDEQLTPRNSVYIAL